LDDEDFLTLRNVGGLAIAYGQLFSMSQLAILKRLDQFHGEIVAKQAANSGSANVAGFSLSLSLSKDEGSLMFE